MTRPPGLVAITCEVYWGLLGSDFPPSFVEIMFSRCCVRLTMAHAWLKYRVVARRTIATTGSHERKKQPAVV
jgi:hypothetical protein